MLHTEAIEPATLELLKSLQKQEYLRDFYLVGGSALALFYGHRTSIDIDLFSNVDFDALRLLEQIQHQYTYQLFNTAEFTLKGSINKINVDILAHRYPYLQQSLKEDGISLLSEQDIIAMKLNAISVSGQRSKDFIDIYYALENHTIFEMIGFYKKKYEQESAAHVVKSLIYFDNVDLADWPVLIKDPKLKWRTVKDTIEKEVMHFINET